MLGSDSKRDELERLVRLRRERAGPPSPRQMLTAKTIDPNAWGAEADEQIAYCRRHGLLGSEKHFGSQFVVMRRLSLIKAEEILRALDRQAAGLSDLEPLSARAASTRLRKKAFDLHCAALPKGLHTKAADAVFGMNGCDGVPAPRESIHDDGRVTLTWTERGRKARLDIDVSGAMTMTLDPAVVGPIVMTFRSWQREDDGVLTAVTDWVHHDGPVPHLAS